MPDPICWICLGPMRRDEACAWWLCPCRLTVIKDEDHWRDL